MVRGSHCRSSCGELTPVSYRSAPFKIQDIGRNHVRVMGGSSDESLVLTDAMLEGPCIFIRLELETGTWPFLLRNDRDSTVTFCQAVRPSLLLDEPPS